MEDPRLFTLPCSLGDSKPFDTLGYLRSCINIISLYLFKKLNIFGLAYETKSDPVEILKDVEVHIGKLKLFNDFYVIDMKKDLKTPLLVGRGFLVTTDAVIDYRMAKVVVGEGITRSVFGVKGVDLGEEEAPYWTTLGKRESYKPRPHTEGDKPPKNEDGAWHAKIRLIDPDGEEFTKTLQSIPTTRKLFERESIREIIDLAHFYDLLEEMKSKHRNLLGEVPAKMEDPRLFTLPCSLGDSKPFDTLAYLGSCINIISLYLFKKLNIFRLAYDTKSDPVEIVKDLEVYIGKLKLFNDFYVIDMKKDLETPLLVERGFLVTADAVMDYRMAKVAVGEGITRSIFGVKGVDLGGEEAPYWTTLGKRESYKPRPHTEGVGA
nr:hypothetical protein [Tanacetum cinerariifolium]